VYRRHESERETTRREDVPNPQTATGNATTATNDRPRENATTTTATTTIRTDGRRASARTIDRFDSIRFDLI